MITVLNYFRELSKIWITWLFLILDGLGFFLLLISYFRPNFTLPFWSLWLLVAITIIGFIAANVKMYADSLEERNLLAKKIDSFQRDKLGENSFYIGQYFPNSSPYLAVEIKYIDGESPIEIKRVSCIYKNIEGKETETEINHFFPLSDGSLIGLYINLNILNPGEGVRFHPPQKISGSEIAIILKVVETREKRPLTIRKMITLKPSPDSTEAKGVENPFYD